jgi:hypothetical protein
MPTPFTHLVTAAHLLEDAALPRPLHNQLIEETGAFLLGNVAADARVSSGIQREQTHFYAYDRPMLEHPWRVMLHDFPTLLEPETPAQRAFIAGYVAHLALDEVWSLQIVRPYFGQAEWAPGPQRFFLLNALLVAMDMRDYPLLENWQRPALLTANPQSWVPFMTDADLTGWRDFVGIQLPPGGVSQTLEVIGPRVGQAPHELGAFIQSAESMAPLYANVPADVLAQAEHDMAERARHDLLAYWEATESP